MKVTASKKRVKDTFNLEIPDRVPINYMCNPAIDLALKTHFNLSATDDEGLKKALNVDFRQIKANYIGPALFKQREGRKTDELFGFVTKYVAHESGGYNEYCDFPLKDATLEEIERYNFPNPDNFDYDDLLRQCQAYKDFGIVAGDNGTGLIMCRAGFLRGFEQALVDLITEDSAGLLLIDKFLAFQLGYLERLLAKVGKQVDLLWMGEDLGTQIAPLISMEIFKKHILPRHKPFIDLASSYNIPVMLHTCGCSSWAYEEYIKIGLRGVDTLQPEATLMAPKYLKETFGGRLVFHGCISTAGALTYGRESQVEEEVKNTLEIMMQGGGYCLAPTHRLQDNTPVKNALKMYETAIKYGKYR